MVDKVKTRVLNEKFDSSPPILRKFEGLAAAYGNLDRNTDVLAPGCFASCLADFLTHGFIAFGHSWHKLPVARPIAALETSSGLYIAAEFHPTSVAGEAARVLEQRLGNRQSFGLSVGFEPLEMKGFRNGALLVDYLKRNSVGRGSGIRLLEESADELAEWDRPCRLIVKAKTLFEVSLVPVPMNPLATVRAVH